MKRLLIPLLSIFLVSCSVERTYYVLAPIGRAPTNYGVALGIGPVTVADYLIEKPYVMFQSTPNRMEISELHEWAGDLQDDVARVLGTNLGKHVGTGNIHRYPWDRESEIRYQVTVDVKQLHGTADGEAVLEASWRTYDVPAGRLLASRTTTLREDLAEDGFDELVAAESRLIDQLAAVIARSLR